MRGSHREYARHRGCSHVAVGKAVKAGRIADAVGQDGKIDFALADALWAANTNAIKQASTGGGAKTRDRNPRDHAAKARPVPEPPDTPEPPRASADTSHASVPPPMEAGGGVSLVKAQTMKAVFSAQREKLKFEEESGKKIDRDDVRVRSFNRARRARDMLLSAPPRIAPLLVGITDIVQITLTLEEEFRQVCEEIATDASASI